MAFRRAAVLRSSFWDSASEWAISVSGYRKYGTLPPQAFWLDAGITTTASNKTVACKLYFVSFPPPFHAGKPSFLPLSAGGLGGLDCLRLASATRLRTDICMCWWILRARAICATHACVQQRVCGEEVGEANRTKSGTRQLQNSGSRVVSGSGGVLLSLFLR